MIPMSPALGRVYEGIRRSRQLEKMAGVVTGDDLVRVLASKAENDYATFSFAKEASIGQTVANYGKAFASNPAGKGFLMAAGAAVPAVAAGNMISDHATEQARNRALETAGGIAALGGTMYGLHHMMNRNKTASADEEAQVDAAIEKLASIGYLDELLAEAISASTDEEQKKLAAEVRCMNREYGVEILGNLIDTGDMEKGAGVKEWFRKSIGVPGYETVDGGQLSLGDYTRPMEAPMYDPVGAAKFQRPASRFEGPPEVTLTQAHKNMARASEEAAAARAKIVPGSMQDPAVQERMARLRRESAAAATARAHEEALYGPGGRAAFERRNAPSAAAKPARVDLAQTPEAQAHFKRLADAEATQRSLANRVNLPGDPSLRAVEQFANEVPVAAAKSAPVDMNSVYDTLHGRKPILSPPPIPKQYPAAAHQQWANEIPRAATSGAPHTLEDIYSAYHGGHPTVAPAAAQAAEHAAPAAAQAIEHAAPAARPTWLSRAMPHAGNAHVQGGLGGLLGGGVGAAVAGEGNRAAGGVAGAAGGLGGALGGARLGQRLTSHMGAKGQLAGLAAGTLLGGAAGGAAGGGAVRLLHPPDKSPMQRLRGYLPF